MNTRPVRIMDYTSGQYITVPAQKKMPCGRVASIDREACYPAYRCDTCNMVEGSVGMPKACRQAEGDVS